MHLSSLIADYGYWAVFVGCMLEGETVLLLAGFAAHRGMLQVEYVAVLAFLASTLGDQTFYWIGRRYGDALFTRFPRLGQQVPHVQRLLDRHHTSLILGIRFIYGLRMAGPVAMGALKVPALRFAWLNAVGAAIWAVLITTLGYQFGNALELFFRDLRLIEEGVLASILLLGMAHALLSLWRWHKRQR
jgi:membrane protein DedA with SNARE-associated domain